MRLLAGLGKIGIGVSLACLSLSAQAVITCDDVIYGSETYFDSMEKLAVEARLPDNSFNRYHEDIVSDLCNGRSEEAYNWVEPGYVRRSEIESIKEALGLDDRSESGESFKNSRRKFYWEMNLSSAFSDNVAQYYTKQPDSQCGKLAKRALEGNPRAIAELQNYPEYCIWNYED